MSKFHTSGLKYELIIIFYYKRIKIPLRLKIYA